METLRDLQNRNAGGRYHRVVVNCYVRDDDQTTSIHCVSGVLHPSGVASSIVSRESGSLTVG